MRTAIVNLHRSPDGLENLVNKERGANRCAEIAGLGYTPVRYENELARISGWIFPRFAPFCDCFAFGPCANSVGAGDPDFGARPGGDACLHSHDLGRAVALNDRLPLAGGREGDFESGALFAGGAGGARIGGGPGGELRGKGGGTAQTHRAHWRFDAGG